VWLPALVEPELMGFWSMPGPPAPAGSDLNRQYLLALRAISAHLLRRTVRPAGQVPYAEAISAQLRTTSRQALRAINRFRSANCRISAPAPTLHAGSDV